jgi:hypothetical protein
MRKAILGIKAVVLLLWTIIAFGIYGLVNLVGDVAIKHADLIPIPPEALALASWLLLATQKIGFGLVIGIWLVGVIAIVAAGLLLRRLAARRSVRSLLARS